MNALPKCIVTGHFMNQMVVNAFAKGVKGEVIDINKFSDTSNLFATYGILRGAGELIKKSKNFYYLDHGYFKSSKRSFNSGSTFIEKVDGYFRIVYNDLYHSGIGKCSSDRFEKLNISLKQKRNSGEYVILSEPSKYIKHYFNLHDWANKTIKEIKKFTDRKIYVHNKFSKVPLETLLEKAWAFVSDQSTAGLKAMINGIPAHYTNETLKKINSIDNIENGKISEQMFFNLAYGQWTLKEMESGEAWNFISKELIK